MCIQLVLQVNGINIMTIPADTVYDYGLSLMDIYFTKEELVGSLLFKSKVKSCAKPALDAVRVLDVMILVYSD